MFLLVHAEAGEPRATVPGELDEIDLVKPGDPEGPQFVKGADTVERRRAEVVDGGQVRQRGTVLDRAPTAEATRAARIDLRHPTRGNPLALPSPHARGAAGAGHVP